MFLTINLVFYTFPTPSETFLFNLVIQLEKRGHRVNMIVFSKNNNYKHYKERLSDWSGNIYFFPIKSGLLGVFQSVNLLKNPFLLYQTIREFGLVKGILSWLKINFITKNNPDVIHFTYSGIATDNIGSLKFLSERSRLFVSCRGSAEKVKPLISESRKVLLRNLWDKVDSVHCVSMDMKESMEKLGLSSKKAFVNYPAIDIRMFTKKKDDVEKTSSIGFSIVSTGRLHYLKGYVYSIDAISDLIADGHDLYYHIIGDGPDLEALKFLIAERGLTDRIILHGRLNSIEVKNILLSSNIFLLPSLSEGMSNAALEAMCLELPVITTNAGGMSELVQDGINGLVVQRRSSSEIQSAILRMLLDYPKALVMGEMGRKTIIARHDIQKQIGIFESEYQKSLVIE